MRIKRNGFTSLECVISLFIVSTIVFVITSTMHNNINLLNKNKYSRQMLYKAKEIIEDERYKIKNSDNTKGYNLDKDISSLKVKISVKPITYYNCYELKVKVLDNNKEMELNTYVTKK